MTSLNDNQDLPAPDERPSLPAMRLNRKNQRMSGYEIIAAVHAQIRNAADANRSIAVDATLIFHCEQSIAFLAQELLELRTLVEGKD